VYLGVPGVEFNGPMEPKLRKQGRAPKPLPSAVRSAHPSAAALRPPLLPKISKTERKHTRKPDRGYKWDPEAIIAETHPTVVPDPHGRGYVELRCGGCGTNLGTKDRLLKAAVGFLRHYIRNPSHQSALPKGEKNFTARMVADWCTYKRLTDSETRAILTGNAAAYVIEDVGRIEEASEISLHGEGEEDEMTIGVLDSMTEPAMAGQTEDDMQAVSSCSADDEESQPWRAGDAAAAHTGAFKIES